MNAAERARLNASRRRQYAKRRLAEGLPYRPAKTFDDTFQPELSGIDPAVRELLRGVLLDLHEEE